MVSLILITSQNGPRLLFESSLLHLEPLVIRNSSRLELKETKQKDEFDDYLACLVYASTLGVFPYGKLLPFQSYHIVFDCCPFLASTTALQLVSIDYFYCFSFSSFSLFILILSSLNKNSHRPILILSCSFGRSRSRREARRLGKRSPTTFIHSLESARKKRHLFGSVGLLGMAEIRARANVH